MAPSCGNIIKPTVADCMLRMACDIKTLKSKHLVNINPKQLKKHNKQLQNSDNWCKRNERVFSFTNICPKKALYVCFKNWKHVTKIQTISFILNRGWVNLMAADIKVSLKKAGLITRTCLDLPFLRQGQQQEDVKHYLGIFFTPSAVTWSLICLSIMSSCIILISTIISVDAKSLNQRQAVTVFQAVIMAFGSVGWCIYQM